MDWSAHSWSVFFSVSFMFVRVSAVVCMYVCMLACGCCSVNNVFNVMRFMCVCFIIYACGMFSVFCLFVYANPEGKIGGNRGSEGKNEMDLTDNDE